MRFKEEVENPMVNDSYWKRQHNLEVLDYDHFENEDDEVRCEVCGALQFKEEAAASQIWEDQYICDEKACIEKHHVGWKESMSLQKYYKGQTL